LCRTFLRLVVGSLLASDFSALRAKADSGESTKEGRDTQQGRPKKNLKEQLSLSRGMNFQSIIYI
jgi:hypothetical protein